MSTETEGFGESLLSATGGNVLVTDVTAIPWNSSGPYLHFVRALRRATAEAPAHHPSWCRHLRNLCCTRLTAPLRAAGQTSFAYSSRRKRESARFKSPGGSEPRFCSIEAT